jgi:hypothetical protein
MLPVPPPEVPLSLLSAAESCILRKRFLDRTTAKTTAAMMIKTPTLTTAPIMAASLFVLLFCASLLGGKGLGGGEGLGVVSKQSAKAS